MPTYFARVMDAENGSEAGYNFEGPPDLMKQAADDIVRMFLDEVDHDILDDRTDWELNAAFNNRDRHIVTAIGSLIPTKEGPPIPFLFMISDHDSGEGAD